MELDIRTFRNTVEHERIYRLEDCSKDRQWTAKLVLTSEDSQTISSFELGWLSLDSVSCTDAWDKDKNRVYNYMAGRSLINAIYDDMPLGDGWPRPKAPAS